MECAVCKDKPCIHLLDDCCPHKAFHVIADKCHPECRHWNYFRTQLQCPNDAVYLAYVPAGHNADGTGDPFLMCPKCGDCFPAE